MTFPNIPEVDTSNNIDLEDSINPVSYTHLDVYKRQIIRLASLSRKSCEKWYHSAVMASRLVTRCV